MEGEEQRAGPVRFAPEENAGERRASLRSRLAFALLFTVALALTGYVMWPFRVPLLLAAVLASVLHGVFQRVCRLCGGRRWLGALLTTLWSATHRALEGDGSLVNLDADVGMHYSHIPCELAEHVLLDLRISLLDRMRRGLRLSINQVDASRRAP